MKENVIRAGVDLLRKLYAPVRNTKTEKRISFLSRQSDTPSMDIMMLKERIERDYPDVECRVLVKMLETTLTGTMGYFGHMMKQMKAIASSEVVVLDGYCIPACVLDHKPQTSVVQMWHSVAAIKKFGYQTIDMPSGHSREIAEIMCMHRNYDYIVCPGGETGKLFAEAFNASEDRLVEMGLPRVDMIRKGDSQIARQIRNEYGFSEESRIALYAPTFRKGSGVNVRELAKAMKKTDYELVVKLHPVYEDDGDVPEDVLWDKKYSSYEWLNACDIVISDYSSLGMEAALTGKPVYFYVYDIDEYDRNVGININPLIEIPSASSEKAEELCNIIAEDYDFDELDKFADRYLRVPEEDCTGKLADFLVGLMNR